MTLPPPSPSSTALVTRASSGIGAELARTSDVRADTLQCDLADPASRARLVAEIDARELPVEVLVNCAGLGSGGMFKDLDLAGELDIVRIECEAILDVASIAGHAPIPRQATYAASKAFVGSFSHALHSRARCDSSSGTGSMRSASSPPDRR